VADDLRKLVSKNVVVLALTRVVTWSSTLVLMLFLPRYLGPIEYGRFYLATSIVTMFSLFIDFGGSYSITKVISRHQDRVAHVIADSITIRVFLWAGSFVGILAYAHWTGYHPTVQTIMLICGVGMLWSGARGVLWSCYRGFDLLKYPSYGAMAETVFVAAVGITAVVRGWGTIAFATITVLGTFINFLVCARYATKMTKKLASVDWKAAFASLKEGLPYFLNSVFGVIYYRIDTVMLSFMSTESVVGWYGASYKFFDTLMFIPSIFTIAVFPVMARLWGEGKTSFSRPLQKSLDFILLVGVPISIIAFMYARQFISFIYGLQGYANSVVLLKIFAVGILLVYIDMILGTVLLASDKQKQLTRNSFLAIFVNVILNWILIPYAEVHYMNGGIGSAIATLVTELFIMITMIAALPKNILAESRVRVQLKVLASGVLMLAVVQLTRTIGLVWYTQGILSLVMYGGAIYFLGVLEPAELRLLRSVTHPLDFWRDVQRQEIGSTQA
jgi:O-antigen/teichoic acid export membrane protein